MNRRADKIQALISKGVTIPAPDSVEIGEEVAIDNISGSNVHIHAGSRIYGQSTFIADGVVIGYEGPATVVSCQAGPSVNLGAGFFEEAVFFPGARAGTSTHARTGTILEEKAAVAHTVGLKQTILFPFVTLGSLINFCDCLMAGGTGPKNHSEVGSSYIHFNFSPSQDKATPSLFGDVPRGVLPREKPIFLGGQGGAVGPLRLAFGTVTAAGTICRKDELQSGRLIVGKTTVKGGSLPYPGHMFGDLNRIVANNIRYIANLAALARWYEQVRALFIDAKTFPEALLAGGRENLNRAIGERLYRLAELADKIPAPAEAGADKTRPSPLARQKKEFIANKNAVTDLLRQLCGTENGREQARHELLEAVSAGIAVTGKDYLAVIRSLDETAAQSGAAWLQSIIDNIMSQAGKILPDFALQERQ